MAIRCAALTLALVLAAPAGAADSDAALAVIRKTLGATQGIVNGEGTRDEKLAALRSVAQGILDTRAMGERAMGHELASQTPEQQAEYFELFDHLMVRAYLSKLLLFREPRFAYRTPQPEGDFVLVRTKIVTGRDAYDVDYEMVDRDGRWAAADVIVEGLSLSDNYRDQFASLLRGRNFEELLGLMRRKTRRLREEPE